MKTPLFSTLVIALILALLPENGMAKIGRGAPIEQARHHLEKAHSLLTKSEEGATLKKKEKPVIPTVISLLSDAEMSLHEAKNNKGSNTPVALKLIADAKAELDAAKGGKESEHFAKADDLIMDALKHVIQAIHVKK